MKLKTYQQIKTIIILFIGIIIVLAVFLNAFLLAVIGLLTGMLFLILARSRTKIKVDEREMIIREKAAQLAYAIFAPTIGIGAVLMLIPSYSGLSVFSKGEFTYLESLGVIFAYLALFLISLYAISYYFLNRKYGGGSDEE